MGKAKTAIIIVVLAALIGGYYFYLSNKTETPKETTVSAVQDVILRDLDKSYPPTPKEVVKYYSELSKCLYNEKYSTEEFEQMADKMLALYDDELLEANPRDQYLMDLNSAISDFRKQDYSITTFTPSQSTDVEESVVKGRECAKLYCTYTIKSGASYSTSLEVFELRKDQAGHWKILGFQLASSVE
ncbi:MAG: hypothetical protein MR392_09170 [Roseburia sp.]|nr:hypothetical protein [Roseburia sp.]